MPGQERTGSRLLKDKGRAPNTIELRNEWGREKIRIETEGGTIEPFQKWAKKNFPHKPILD